MATAIGGSLKFYWPADHTGRSPQAQTNLLAKGLDTNWAGVPDSPAGIQITNTISLKNGLVFYWLIHRP